MEQTRASLREFAVALTLVALVGLGTIIGVGTSVPQKPPATPSSTQIVESVLPPTSLPRTTPATRIMIRRTAGGLPPSIYPDWPSAQVAVPWVLRTPETASSTLESVSVRYMLYDAVQAVLAVYKNTNGATLEFWQYPPGVINRQTREALQKRTDTFKLAGTYIAAFDNHKSGLRLTWIYNNFLFILVDRSGTLHEADLLRIAESVK